MIRRTRKDVLHYHNGKRLGTATLWAAYTKWRQQQVPPLAERCDNNKCIFYTQPLLWNGIRLKPNIDHINGVNTDNSTMNLRFLCPNCHSQCRETTGGANKGRITKADGGYAIKRRESPQKDYTMKLDTGKYESIGRRTKVRR